MAWRVAPTWSSRSVPAGPCFSRGRARSSDGSARLDQPDCHVFFDPESIENSWAEQYPGAMIGYTTCLVAGIARELLLAPDAPDVHRGVTRGLAAERALHLAGLRRPRR